MLLWLQIARELSKQRAVELGLEEIDRVRPIPDPQDTGLLKGKGAVARAQAQQDAAAAAAAAATETAATAGAAAAAVPEGPSL